ncbi:MAG: hypothetical protein K0V04_36660 [Deltaproteobacteria bacterium]|nr:hypothetical protein [Deltaproteobacteria bacterium]
MDPQPLQSRILEFAEDEIEPLLHLSAQLEALGVVAGPTSVARPGWKELRLEGRVDIDGPRVA